MSSGRRPRTGSPSSALLLAGMIAGSLAGLSGARADAALLRVGEAVLEPVALDALPGFAGDDLAAALATFRATCAQPAAPVLAEAAPKAPSQDLAVACAAAATVPPEGAKGFFLQNFAAYRVLRPARENPAERQAGFLTGYFEPELVGSPVPTPDFTVPALARPDDLVSLEPGETRPGLDPSLRAARR
ncbi:transglycosylase, partial [Methylobacterium indicum]